MYDAVYIRQQGSIGRFMDRHPILTSAGVISIFLTVVTSGAVIGTSKLEKILRTKGVIAHADPPPLPVIGVIHGRMPERELVRTMQRFRAGEINILLATTIIENGLDISSANTLIVEDATRLGLAQAHQLRGRIGRGNAHAFAYFLFRTTRLTDKSRNRLEALQEYATLGAGYALALRDLEIRGTGNILGREQSGTAYKVGLNLYYQMLAEAVEHINAYKSSAL